MDKSTTTQLKRRRGRPYKNVSVDELPNQARALRLKTGMNMRQFAAVLGVAYPTLWDYEVNDKGKEIIFLLADYFKKDPREIRQPGKKFSIKSTSNA